MTAYIYVITECSSKDVADYRTGIRTPKFFKVGRALESKVKGLTPVEYRLACLQSCTTEPLSAVCVLAFDTKADARRIEAEFKRVYTKRFGVGLYKNHEWLHGALPISNVVDWMLAAGARDVTKEHPARDVQACYEINYGTIDPNPVHGAPRFGTTIRLLEFSHQVTWQKLVACRYSEDVTLAAYWTGSPRPITVTDRIVSPSPTSINKVWEECVARVLAEHVAIWQPLEHPQSTATRSSGDKTPWRYSGWIHKQLMEPVFSSIRNRLRASA